MGERDSEQTAISRRRESCESVEKAGDISLVDGLRAREIVKLLAADMDAPGARQTDVLARLSEEAEVSGEPSAPQSHSSGARGSPMQSVREHAVLHFALEQISTLAAREIETRRLAAVLAKPTPLDDDANVETVALHGANEAFQASYARHLTALADDRRLLRAKLRERLRGERAQAKIDALCSGLVPASARTQLRLAVDTRSFAMLVDKMVAHPLGELRSLADDLLSLGRRVAPSAVRSEAASDLRRAQREAVHAAVKELISLDTRGETAVSGPVRLLHHDPGALVKVALALAYDGSGPRSYAAELAEAIRNAGPDKLAGIVAAANGERPLGAPLPRGFEVASMGFEVVVDYGTYREVSRQRRLLAIDQPLSTGAGFDIPRELTDVGLAVPYRIAMLEAGERCEELAKLDPGLAPYAVPLGYRVRSLWTINLRELVYVIESGIVGDVSPSVRRVVDAMRRSVDAVYPWLSAIIRVSA